DEPIGVIVIFRQEVRAFNERQVSLLSNFADQAVIAIENTRLLTEQREALERQTATAEVLQVINASPGDLAPVFEAMLEKAMRLCAAAFGYLMTYAGERFEVVAHHGLPPRFAEYLRDIHQPSSAGLYAAIRRGAAHAQQPDLSEGEVYRMSPLRRALVDLGGARTGIVVALRKDDALLGVITIYRQEVRPFADKEIALLQSFAAQAVIAMENARLLGEQREALEQQTATAEVLEVINASPGNLAPVFDAMLEKAMRLCGASFGILRTYDGRVYHGAASRGVPAAYAEFLTRNPQYAQPGTIGGRILAGEPFVHVVDVMEDDIYFSGDPHRRALVELGGARTTLVVPLTKDRAMLGEIRLYRQQVKAFSDKQIALLQSFAAQAVIAMENARLLTEQREALEQQTATAEVLQVINSSPGNLAPVFATILEKAHALCGVAYGSLQLYDGTKFRAVAVHGLPEPLAQRLREGYTPGPNLRRLIEGADFAHFPDIGEVDDPMARATVAESGIRTLLTVALRKDGNLLGQIVAARLEVRPFADKEIALLRSFAAQAVIAMENARLLTEQREALERQTATAEVLEVINASPGDLEPVFDAMLEKAMTLCGAAFGFMTTYDGERFTPAAMRGLPAALAEYFAAGMDQPRGGEAHARLLEGEDLIHNLDQMDEDAYRSGSPLRRAVVDLGGARTALVVALRKERVLLGTLTVYRKEVRAFSDKEVALMQSFAAQAVIAMENARLLTEQREALERQTATAEVLQVINSSPGNLAPVFDAMLERAMHLCEAAFGVLWLYDGEQFSVVATHAIPGALAEFVREPVPVEASASLGELARGDNVVHVPDLAATELYHAGNRVRRAYVQLGGARTVMSVALRKDNALLGAFTIYRQEVRPFSQKQIELVQTFAEQAVIAIENARLLAEQREALEQQTATAEVLEVINASPGNLAPVFEAMLERAVRLSESAFGIMNLYEDGRFEAVALRGVRGELIERWASAPPPGPHNALSRLIAGEDMVHIADLAAYRSYLEGDPRSRGLVDTGGARSLLAVALRKDGKLIGTLTAYRQEVRPFTDKQIALLEGFAAQAVIAIENARLLDELRQRTGDLTESLEYQTATSEVLEVIGRSTSDIQPVLDTMLKAALRLCRTESGGVAIQHEDSYRYAATLGWDFEADKVFRNLDIRAGRGTVAARVIAEGRIVQVADVASDPEFGLPDMAERSHWHTALGVPLMRNDRPVGVIAITRDRIEPFTERQIALVKTFADQAVIAIENARLLEELRQRQAELARSVDELTATGDVLKIISRSSVDFETVLDTLVETVARLCRADLGYLFREMDGRFHLVSGHGLSEETRRFVEAHPISPDDRGTIGGRVAMGRHTVHIPDALNDPEYTYGGQKAAGFRTILGIPLLRGDVLIGVFNVARTRVEPFTDREIELVTSFADQAVIAIENARLFDELRERTGDLQESLEYQTATSEVLSVISRSTTDLEPVLEAMLAAASRLCGVQMGGFAVRRGDVLRYVATTGVSDEFNRHLRRTPHPFDRSTAAGRAAVEKAVAHIPDVEADREYALPQTTTIGNMRALLAVPLLREDEVVGTITLGRSTPGQFSDRQIALIRTFADQAVIAMENARLLGELTRREQELSVTFDNMGDGVAMFDAERRLAAWNRNFQEILDLPDSALAARPTYAEYLRLLAGRGEFGTEDVEAALASRLEGADRELRLERTRPDGTVIEVRRNAVPGGGFVLIYSDVTERKRSEEQIRAARDLAETRLTELKTAQSSLIHAEKMASLGQLTAGIAHEIKNPLNFVNNFAGLSVELLDELREAMAPVRESLGDERRTEIDDTIELLNTNLDKIASHGRRAD
ncbi:MAG TPA: GAF domain-containing protein, partial [Burkholderiales bacterium]